MPSANSLRISRTNHQKLGYHQVHQLGRPLVPALLRLVMAMPPTTTTSEAMRPAQCSIDSTNEIVRTAKYANNDRLRDLFRCTERELADLRRVLNKVVYNLKYQAAPHDPSNLPPNYASLIDQARIWGELIAARRSFRDMLTGARSGAPTVVKPAGFEAQLEDAKRELMLEATNGTAEGCTESPRHQDATCYVLRCTEEELVELRIAIVEAEQKTYDRSPLQGSNTGSSDTVYQVIWKEIAAERSDFRDMLSCARWVEKPAALAWEMEVVKLNLMDDVFRNEPTKLARLQMLFSDAVNGRLWQADGLIDGSPC